MLFHMIFFYIILNTQFFIYETTPMIGRDIRIADLEEFPFVVSLSLKVHIDIEKEELDHFCGGSLITHSHVLTAAHCLNKLQPEDVVVKIGSRDLRNAESYDIKWWFKYSQYANVQVPSGRDVNSIYDIAILRLGHDVSSDIELPILSYSKATQFYGKSFMTAGWGRITGARKPRYMRVGKFFVVRPEKCKAISEQSDPLLKDIRLKFYLCTQAAPFAMTTCGDSGSPLFSNESRLIGINKSYCFPGENITLHNVWNLHIHIGAFAPFIEEIKNME